MTDSEELYAETLYPACEAIAGHVMRAPLAQNLRAILAIRIATYFVTLAAVQAPAAWPELRGKPTPEAMRWVSELIVRLSDRDGTEERERIH